MNYVFKPYNLVVNFGNSAYYISNLIESAKEFGVRFRAHWGEMVGKNWTQKIGIKSNIYRR